MVELDPNNKKPNTVRGRLFFPDRVDRYTDALSVHLMIEVDGEVQNIDTLLRRAVTRPLVRWRAWISL